MAEKKTEGITLRLSPEVKAKLDDARAIGPYSLTITAIVERGIELAWRELKGMSEEQGSVVRLNRRP